MKTASSNAQMFLPGLIRLVQLPDGTAIARVHELQEWLTVREAAEFASCGEDLIRARIDDGTFTHRWKDHAGERGTCLILSQSLQMWLDARQRIGKYHPQLALK